jgi:hypothetical protein
MGFIKVKKGKKIISIPRATYEKQFKAAGWEEVYPEPVKNVEDNVEAKEEPVESSDDSDNESDEDWDEAVAEAEAEEEDRLQELLEKPISDLTPDEVRAVADAKGIDTKGKNIKQIREAIRKSN